MDTTKAEEQYLFDRSLEHIRKQGTKSTNKATDVCKYRGPNGLMCGAGIFIISYFRAMEGKSWQQVVEYFPQCVEPVAAEHSGFVDELQSVHDASAKSPGRFISEYNDNMEYMAEKHGLTYTPPNKELPA